MSAHAYGPAKNARHRQPRPKNTEFQLFVTQQPNSPFGISWYQSDFETNNQGHGEVNAIGIFAEELFVVAPGSVTAPQVDALTPRRTRPSNRCTPTILDCGSAPHRRPGCRLPCTVTPFDGGHNAASRR